MIIWLSGPTGSGKTSLAKLMSGWGFEIVREDIPEAAFAKFIADPTRYCEILQEEIMRSRLSQWKALRRNSSVVFDRSVQEDFLVFCKLHCENGFLETKQFLNLTAIYEEIQKELPLPDCIIFMSNNVDTLRSRLVANNYPSIICKTLPRQFSLYESWANARPEQLLRVDNSRFALSAVERLFRG